MPLPPRLFAGDEELGKKDDDHRPGMKSPYTSWTASQHRRAPNRRSIKRVLIVATTLIGLYYFFKNMPTDLTQPRPRPTYTHTDSKTSSAGSHSSGSSTHKGGKKGELEEQSQHYFDGPIKFYQLATTLHTLSVTKGGEHINHNVLFAAASLKSVSALLPIACEMAEKKRNIVHFAVMGRDTLSMDIIKAVNGLEDGCNILYHDARPDYSVESTEFRMAVSTSAALGHINTFMHPQAILVDGSEEEEAFFMRGIKERAASIGRTVIELPKNTEQSLLWITELDYASLSSWNRFTVDILVHAPPAASGSLIRLLESLRKADYFSSLPPRLTIDLPQKIDEPTRRYLENFKWPPSNVVAHGAGSQLSLHHRIPQHGLTPEENNIRFLEAFWPADPSSSHILVLSSEVELSPVYFHYLKFTTLEYRYSTAQRDAARNLLGISLDLPSTYLNDSTGFEAPTNEDLEGSSDTADYSSPFLWQAPNSNAALYFGEKWAELHDFVSHTLKAQHKLPTPTTLNQKLVSKTFPSWLEHVLQLARARGYWTLYPTFSSTNSLATIHNELYRIPEEFSKDPESENEHLDPGADTDAELTADPAHHLSLKHTETPLFSTTLLGAMSGTLPEVKDMPLLSWNGEQISRSELEKRAVEHSRIFRREIGGCEILSPEKQRLDLMAGDLFCLNEGDNVPLPPPKKEEEEPLAPAIEPVVPSPETASTPVGTLNTPSDAPVLVKGAR